MEPGTLFVFTDQALGPWVPLVADQPHVIHCHDFLAQRSALGEIPENMSSWTGRQYQAFIRRGYLKGKNFISVSQNTRNELHRFLSFPVSHSEMIYNGLNQSFVQMDPAQARVLLQKKTGIDLSAGYLLHVGGNQWYKNRKGVIEIYNAWCHLYGTNIPLLLLGAPPAAKLNEIHQQSPFKSDIHWLTGLHDEYVRMAYSGASVFLFPSLAEGFGWPIAEAMAAGCPVITTNEAPMTEVAGAAGFLIPKRPFDMMAVPPWAKTAAEMVETVLRLSPPERTKAVHAGIENAKRFNTELALDQIEKTYLNVLQSYKN